MALKAIVDKLDSVPEAHRGLYAAGKADDGTEGKFVLQVESVSGFALENVEGLKSALGKERTKVGTLEAAVAGFKGLDPEKVKTDLAKLADLEKIDPATEADKIAEAKVRAATDQLVAKHTQEADALKSTIAGLSKSLEGYAIDAVATAAIAKEKGVPELLMPLIRAQTRVKMADGKVAVEVLDKDGNVRIGDAKGNPMTIEGLVAEMKSSEAYGRAFEGSGQSGTGKRPGETGGPAKTTQGNVGGTREEREAAFAARFPELQ